MNRRYRVVIGPGAEGDVNAILAYIRPNSERGAVTVEEEIFGKLAFLESLPEGTPVDENAPEFPQSAARGRRAIAGNYEILYAFPVEYQGDTETVAILFVRDARRNPLDQTEIEERFIELILTSTPRP